MTIIKNIVVIGTGLSGRPNTYGASAFKDSISGYPR